MNHVPDAVLARLDALGRATLHGESCRIAAGLRRDLRVHVAYDGGREPFVVRLCHRGDRQPRIRDHGPWLSTYVDGVDRRLADWGVRTPTAYRSGSGDPSDVRDTAIEEPADWIAYDGRVTLPGEPSVE